MCTHTHTHTHTQSTIPQCSRTIARVTIDGLEQPDKKPAIHMAHQSITCISRLLQRETDREKERGGWGEGGSGREGKRKNKREREGTGEREKEREKEKERKKDKRKPKKTVRKGRTPHNLD